MTCAHRVADDTIPFVSVCPQCFQDRLQQLYSRRVLDGFLKDDHAIEAYCAECEQFWSISPNERSALVRLLAVLGVIRGSSAQLH